MRPNIVIWIVTAMMFSSHCGLSAATGAPSDAAWTVLQDRPDRLIVVLPNRLVVVAQELQTAPVVTAQVHVKTGSIFENTEQRIGAGLSHFLEHLVSGGTTGTRTEEQSNRVLGRIGAITNASTGLDKVRYYVHTTSDHTSEAIDLVSDWLNHSRITDREYERERDVIQREFEMGLGEPRRIFWKLTQQARYRHHPARHPTIGYLDEFLKISRDDIYAFYRQMYVPNNMLFLVVGAIDRHQVVEQVARLWADVPARPLPTVRLPVEPEVDSPRVQVGTADIERPRLRLAWPGTRLGGPGDYALDVLGVILGQGESSRLVRTVRDQHRAVNMISAYNLSFSWGEGFFGIDCEIADGADGADTQVRIDRARALIFEQIERIKDEGITEIELRRAQRQVLADAIYDSQSVEALAGQLSHGLIDMGDPDYQDRYVKAIAAMTPEQVNGAVRDFLLDNRLMTITLLPAAGDEKAEAMTRPDDAAWPKDAPVETLVIDNERLVTRVRRNVGGEDADAASIDSDAPRLTTLENGLRVIIGRSTLVPAVAVQIYQRGGLLSDTPGQEGVAKAVARMRIRGAGDRTAQQIAAQIEDLGASVSTDSGFNSSFTRAVCLKQDWPAVLDLFADVVLNPSFDAQEWERMKPRLLAAIDRETDTWHGELRKSFRGRYFEGHPWSQTPLGRRDVVAALSADDLREAFGRRIGAADSVLAVFGDVDPDETLNLIRRHFAEMPPKPADPFVPPAPTTPAAEMLLRQTSKPLGAVQIGYGPGITRASEHYAGIQVLTRVLSRFPTGWLDRELRGKEGGLVYAVGCGQFAGLVPGYVSILFNAGPDKLVEALGRAAKVDDRARTELVDADHLADAKAALLTAEFFAKQSNGDRAAQAALDTMYGLELDESERFMERVKAIGPEELRDLARRHLRDAVTVVLSHKELDEAALQEAMQAGE
ncbi:MAG: hypothetical protein CMJ18_22985 [Phycisphaeraceae bacterium]|nr:hypothetical protein [Phycisphaeraceae bacterium]